MMSAARQKGMTPIGWVLVMALIVVVTLIVLKLFPIYMDGMKVSSILSDMREEPGLATKTPNEIRVTFFKRLEINLIRSVRPDDLYIERDGNTYSVEVEYEVRENLIGNLDVVASFNKKVTLEGR